MRFRQSVGFCTLAIGAAYHWRARLVCADIAPRPMVVLTDAPEAFADLPVTAIRHAPTGPMAADIRRMGIKTGVEHGEPAYHDKRFALQAVLERARTAIYLDADTRVSAVPRLRRLPRGFAARPEPIETIDEHLKLYGAQRRPLFEALAVELLGSADVLRTAHWCYEDVFAVTRDGREAAFFEAWGYGARYLQERRLFLGEGGVIGLAAAAAGWSMNFEALSTLAAAITQEARGPKFE